MANIRKSFNLRNGVQVDEDNLFVNSLGNVGLGTTVPGETLDVRGNIKVVGVVTSVGAFISGGLESAGVSTFTGNVHVGSAITMYPSSGIISATSFRGDGASLTNIPTSQWTDVDPSLNIVSIYNTGSVGIATTLPKFTLQVGGNSDLSNFQNGVGINSSGNMVVTGVVTAGVFKGEGSDITSLNATNIKSGIVSNAYLQAGYQFSGILTASQFKGNVIGDVVGFATTARDLVDGLDLSFGSFTSDNAQVGVLTVTGSIVTPGDNAPIGVGTTAPQSDLHVKKAGISSAQVSSDTNASIITLSRGLDQQGTAGEFRYGNVNAAFPYSEASDLDIINYSTGSINSYLHAGSAGINTGGFFWLRGKNVDQLMTLTYDKKLGIGVTVPVNNLHVVGTSTVTSNAFIGNNLTVKNDVTVAGDMSVTGSYGLVDSDITGLNLNATAKHSKVKNLDITENATITGITTISGFVAVGNTFSAGTSNHNTRGFGINIDLNNAVAIGTDSPINNQGLNALDVRHGKAIFSGVGVGTTGLTAAIDFRYAGRNHVDVINKAADNNRMYMYPPVVTTAERGNLVGMQEGAMVYDSDLDTICFYNGSAWRKVTHTAA